MSPLNCTWLELHLACGYYVSLISFRPEHLLNISSTFMTLILFKITGHLFCRMFFSLGLSDAPLWLDLGLRVWWEYHSIGASASCWRLWFQFVLSPMIHDDLTRVMLASLLNTMLIFFSFVMNTYFVGRYLETMQLSYTSSNFKCIHLFMSLCFHYFLILSREL